MSLFTTDRERRLWLWTIAVLLAIYSTMGPAQRLAQALRERNLLRISFAVVVFVAVAIVAWRWIRRKPGWREIAVGIAVSLAYLMALLRVNSPEDRTHLLEYGVVAALVHQALAERLRRKRGALIPAALAVVITAGLGWLDEGIQALLPNRVYDLRDAAFNVLAGLMAVVAQLALSFARRRDG